MSGILDPIRGGPERDEGAESNSDPVEPADHSAERAPRVSSQSPVPAGLDADGTRVECTESKKDTQSKVVQSNSSDCNFIKSSSATTRWSEQGGCDSVAVEVDDGELLRTFLDEQSSQDVAEAAFASLVERHKGLVLGVCRRILQDEHEAEDAFQATFLMLSKKARRIRDSRTLGVWLHRVAYRISLRLKNRRRKTPTQLEPYEALIGPESDLQDAVARDTCRMIDEELQRLSPPQRMLIILCCFEGLSYQDVAHRTGLTHNQVKWGLSKARSVLKNRLARRGLIYSVGILGVVASHLEAARAASPEFVRSTAELAFQFNYHPATVAIASKPITLAIEGLHAMLQAQIKTVALVILAVGALGTGSVITVSAAGTSDAGWFSAAQDDDAKVQEERERSRRQRERDDAERTEVAERQDRERAQEQRRRAQDQEAVNQAQMELDELRRELDVMRMRAEVEQAKAMQERERAAMAADLAQRHQVEAERARELALLAEVEAQDRRAQSETRRNAMEQELHHLMLQKEELEQMVDQLTARIASLTEENQTSASQDAEARELSERQFELAQRQMTEMMSAFEAQGGRKLQDSQEQKRIAEMLTAQMQELHQHHQDDVNEMKNRMAEMQHEQHRLIEELHVRQEEVMKELHHRHEAMIKELHHHFSESMEKRDHQAQEEEHEERSLRDWEWEELRGREMEERHRDLEERQRQMEESEARRRDELERREVEMHEHLERREMELREEMERLEREVVEQQERADVERRRRRDNASQEDRPQREQRRRERSREGEERTRSQEAQDRNAMIREMEQRLLIEQRAREEAEVAREQAMAERQAVMAEVEAALALRNAELDRAKAELHQQLVEREKQMADTHKARAMAEEARAQAEQAYAAQQAQIQEARLVAERDRLMAEEARKIAQEQQLRAENEKAQAMDMEARNQQILRALEAENAKLRAKVETLTKFIEETIKAADPVGGGDEKVED